VVVNYIKARDQGNWQICQSLWLLLSFRRCVGFCTGACFYSALSTAL